MQAKQLNRCTDNHKTCKASTADTRKTKSYMSPLSVTLEYRFYNAECRCCKKIVHVAKVCRSKSSSKSTHYLQDSEIPMTDDTSYKLFMMQDETQDPILISLEVNQVSIKTELDSGASLTNLDQ